MQIAAADAAGRDPDARPRRSGQVRFRQVDERRGERRIGHVELHRAHEGSVRGSRSIPRVRVPDAALVDVRQRGFALVEGFLARDELDAARAALWKHYPPPEQYFADPSQYAQFG